MNHVASELEYASRFPTIDVLAESNIEQVNGLWKGKQLRPMTKSG